MEMYAGMYIVALVFAFIGCVLLIIGVMMRIGEKRYADNRCFATATVVRYVHKDYYTGHVPVVVFESDGETRTERCKSRRLNESICPIGQRVPISYVRGRFLGLTVYEVRMEDEQMRPWSLATLGKILQTAGIVFLIIAAILIMIQSI